MNTLAHSPHAHAITSVPKVMVSVMIALTPATLYSLWGFGWPAIFLFLVTILSTVVGEAIGQWLRGLPLRGAWIDGSAILTGWLLALSLPPWAPFWIGIVGGLFASLMGRQIYGGLGQNLFNPAMAARVMLLVSFPLEMTLWTPAMPITSPLAPDLAASLAITFGGSSIDSMTGATLLGHAKTELSRGSDLIAALSGNHELGWAILGGRSGSLGEGMAILLLLGGLWLLWRGTITWYAPVAMLFGLLLPATIAHTLDPLHYLSPLYHLFTGGVILAAFFIVTDPVTSPNTWRGQLLFGLGVGLLTWIIRTWGSYPEGIAFAVLLMNAATPVIDRYIRPRIYGRQRNGAPLEIEKGGKS
jgi:Na+-translocating ferredoxin:NAD+ oxidoreductase subunit D